MQSPATISILPKFREKKMWTLQLAFPKASKLPSALTTTSKAWVDKRQEERA